MIEPEEGEKGENESGSAAVNIVPLPYPIVSSEHRVSCHTHCTSMHLPLHNILCNTCRHCTCTCTYMYNMSMCTTRTHKNLECLASITTCTCTVVIDVPSIIVQSIEVLCPPAVYITMQGLLGVYQPKLGITTQHKTSHKRGIIHMHMYMYIIYQFLDLCFHSNTLTHLQESESATFISNSQSTTRDTLIL